MMCARFNVTRLATIAAGLVIVGSARPSATAADLGEVVVTAAKPASAEDEQLRAQVTGALTYNPYLLSDHITVTLRNGVATLHGIVFDDWDLRNAMRMAREVPGVKRVVNDLEIASGGD